RTDGGPRNHRRGVHRGLPCGDDWRGLSGARRRAVRQWNPDGVRVEASDSADNSRTPANVPATPAERHGSAPERRTQGANAGLTIAFDHHNILHFSTRALATSSRHDLAI